MGTTQLDLIGSQMEAAAHNAAAGTAGRLRQETSLVNKACRLAGKSLTEGEKAWKNRHDAVPRETIRPTRQTEAPESWTAEDGYVRRSPIQPIREAADYRKRLILRVIGIAVLVVVAWLALEWVGRLGLLGR